MLLVWLALAMPAGAQTARVAVLADSASAGAPFRVAVVVERPAGAQVTFPEGPLGEAEVLDMERRPPAVRGATRIDTALYRVLVFTPDTARVGPVPVTVGADTVRAPAATVPVRSVLSGETEPYEPAPVGEPPSFPSAVPFLVAFGLLAAVALWATVGFLIRSFRRPEPVVVVSPADAALAQLSTLEREAPGPGAPPAETEAHVVAVRDVLRRFLAARLGVRSMEATTTELAARLAADARVPASATDAVRAALDPADLVAFARQRPDADAVARLRKDTRTAVEAVEASQRAREAASGDGAPPEGTRNGD
ncbi:hypothetical protein [Rubrivirga sp. IMCC45206]|uniref:hypothetical protein n=1 Tax=Rubrivirga sp. IMCC45206 TaxID=3391614 RepID=UPI0039900356